MTEDIQGFGVVHVGVDNYFRTRQTDPGAFPTDLGLTMGVLPFQKLQMEVGVDYMANTAHPWLFNAKIGTPENALFKNAPALQIGVINATKKFNVGRADTDIFYGVVGKTIPHVGRISAGPYFGNHATMVSSSGSSENTGYMIAFDRGFHTVADKEGEYSRFVIAGDYASGENALGGGGAGLYVYFTKNISLLAGPTFFNDTGVNGRWKFSTQLDINLPQLFKKK